MAGKGFSVQGPGGSTAASTTKTLLTLTASATQLVKINRVVVTQDTHKTSEQYEFFGQRASASGTGTAYTPLLKEPGAGATGVAAKITHTVEPTYTAATIFPNLRWNSLTGRERNWQKDQELYLAPSGIWGLYVTTPSATTTMTPQGELEGEEVG